MRLVFAGTAECSVPVLKMLAKDFNLCAVLTSPPAPSGRSRKLKASPVAQAVNELKRGGILPEALPLFEPCRLDSSFREKLKKLEPTLLVCFAYGKIFGPKTMAVFKLGGINIHPSLLPRWRGPSPVPAAILAGDKITGISIQTLAEKLDSGDILAQKELAILKDDNVESLLNLCAIEACPLLKEVLSDFQNRLKNAKPQNEKEASYSSNLKKEDGLINWEDSTVLIERKIRAFSPWPGAFTYKNGEKINIISANLYNISLNEMTKAQKFGTILGTDKKLGILVATGDGVLAISHLQRQTKKALSWRDFLNGYPSFLDGRFES